MSQLIQNTNILDALIEKANNLPDAGNGNIETCTLKIIGVNGAGDIYITRVIDGIPTSFKYSGYEDLYPNSSSGVFLFTDVMCGSIVVFKGTSVSNGTPFSSNCQILYEDLEGTTHSGEFIIAMPLSKDEIVIYERVTNGAAEPEPH